MAATHHAAPPHQQRFLAPETYDRRLPSIKDLNFPLRHQDSGGTEPPAEQQHSTPQEQPRHTQSWSRHPHATVSPPVPMHQQHQHPQHTQQGLPQQQHTPPLSAGHDHLASKAVEYPPKHVSGNYYAADPPMSGQMTPVPSAINSGAGSRGDQSSQPKRARHSRNESHTINAPRERPPHQGYPPPYSPYNTSQPHYPMNPAPEQSPIQTHPHPQQIHHSPVMSHQGYAGFGQQPYVQARPSSVLQQAPQQAPPVNAYSSPASALSQSSSREVWEQQAPQQMHVRHQSFSQPPPPHRQQLPLPPPPAASAPAQPPAHAHSQQHGHQGSAQPHPTPQQYPQPPSSSDGSEPMQQQQGHLPQPILHPSAPLPRTSGLVSADSDPRGSYEVKPSVQAVQPERTMHEIVELCSVLYSFASRYAQIQFSLPHVQPSPTEVHDMSQKAHQVVKLLEDLRRLHVSMPESSQPPAEQRADVPMADASDDRRPPKRPWEDMSSESPNEAGGSGDGNQEAQLSATDKQASPSAPTSTAEKDMEIIRIKRAYTIACPQGSTGNASKTKTKKKPRANAPGKCHSCNSRETPEWRRGPDGARTLCNACGLHYAKLMRKRMQSNDPNAPNIDLETLRASARAADMEKNAKKAAQHSEPKANDSMSQHQTSFQVMSVVNSNAPSPPVPPSASQQQIPPPPSSSGHHSMSIPPPGWGGPPPPPPQHRPYSANDGAQHHSYMRSTPASSHPPSR